MKKFVFVFTAFLVFVSGTAYGSSGELISALGALEGHVTGVNPLSGIEIASYKQTIDTNKTYFGTDYDVMVEARGLVETYDSVVGPLFVNRNFWRSSTSDEDVDWVIFHVMQYIMDYSYTTSNIEQYESLLGSFIFECSAKFPGACDPPADPNNTHTATINASYPDTLGWLRQGDNLPARKPTGTYLAPGTVVTVTVPNALVNAGYEIRVGAHSWDMSRRPPVRRLDRSSLVFPIESVETKVSNPLGGGIYIEVPYLAGGGVVDVEITGAVRSPFYSYNTVTGHITTVSEWQDVERKHRAPWADFQTEKFMCQVPTSWIYNFDDPVTAMANWDLGVDINNDLMGFPRDRGKETYYLQLDVINRASVFAPGYPAVNQSDSNPTRDSFGGDRSHYFVRGPQIAPDYCMHEQGHAYFFDKFSGEMESAVNLAHVSVWHQGFGYDLDYAFAASRGFQGNPNRTLDNTAVTWMTVFNFALEAPMADGEKAYQLKGHAKFVDIAYLFGWQVIEDYYAQLVAEGKNKNTSGLNDDDRILRMSIAAGVDLTPLFHFWGIHPIDPVGLAADVAAEGLPSSSLIYDRLVYYRSLIPADNAAFQEFALGWHGRQPSVDGYMTERAHARQWDSTNYWESRDWMTYSGTDPDKADGEIYAEASCARIQNVVDKLIEKYFPEHDSVPPRTNPPTWEYVPTPGGGDGFTDHLGILTSGTMSGNNPATGQAWAASDKYRITFFTSATTDATSSDIATYNSWVQGLADATTVYNIGADEGVTWKVVGSTSNVDARDNTSTNPYVDGSGCAIFLLDGSTVVANDNADLWDGSIQNIINLTEQGTINSWWPFTGSYIDGTRASDHGSYGNLGSGGQVVQGNSSSTTQWIWRVWTGSSSTSQLQMYALSEPQLLKPTGDTDTTIAMIANEAYDPSGVEYYFTETSGNSGGSDSGWQDSPFYVDTGLSPGMEYTYTVTVRDKSINQNSTAPSEGMLARTTGGAFGRYDFNDDSRIDTVDLSVLGLHWLGERSVLYEDATEVGTVNIEDLAGMAGVWAEGVE